MRQRLLQWLDAQRIRPRIVAEFDDRALLNTFGQAGAGVFPVPSVIARSVSRECSVVTLGTTDGVTEQYYAISMERRFTHPAVIAVGEVARRGLFKAHNTRLRHRLR